MQPENPVPPAPIVPIPPSIEPSSPVQKPKQSFVLLIVFLALLLLTCILSFSVGFLTNKKALPQAPTPTPMPLSTSSPAPITPMPSIEPSANPTATPEPQTKTIKTNSNLDGFQSSNGAGNNIADIRAGRNNFLVTRGFVSFDLSTIPKSAVIESATLRIYQTSTTGNPYGVGGSINADQMDFGPTLENSDYQLSPLRSNVGSISTGVDIGWKELEVTESIKDDFANARIRAQYRLHFVTESIGGETGGDFAYFESGENFVGTGNTPELVVKYH